MYHLSKSFIYCLFLIFMCLNPLSAFGEQVIVDLNKVDQATATAIRNAQQQSSEAITPDKIEDWAGIGVKLGEAIQALCKTLNTEVNEFAKTPVGMFSMVIISWKVFGSDLLGLWDVVGGFFMFFCINGITMWSFRHFHMQKKNKKEVDDKEVVEYERRYEFSDSENEAFSVVIHMVVFALATITCLVIIF